MAALYDGLPLNTPTKVGGDATCEIWATRTANGGTVETRAIGAAATAAANEETVNANLAALITSLQADVTQDQSVISGANTILATTGTLTSAQLSTHVRSLASAVKALANNDINNKKAMANLLRKVQGYYADITGT